MSLPRTPFRWVLPLATAAVLAACGGDSAPTPPASAPSAEAPAPVPTPQIADGTRTTVALLETSDLHSNIRSYDYFKLAEDQSYGFERTATLIQQARSEFANNVLLDNGDTIQGTALADYEATVDPMKCDQTLSMYKVMNHYKYDVGTLGNHEFNYGLPFLNQVLGGGLNVDGVNLGQTCKGPDFPMVLANVYSLKTGQPLVQPYTILQREFTATTPDGKSVTVPIKVGVIGFTTPGIMNWDKRFVEGKLRIDGAVETAQKYLPEMRQKGADVVVALVHGGLSSAPYAPTMENSAWHLAKVPGIDAMFMGHSHSLFPDRGTRPAYTMEGVDNAAGTIHGVPATMPSFWGKALGVIKLELVRDAKNSTWVIDKSKTLVEARETVTERDSKGKAIAYVTPDPRIAELVEAQHQATITYVKTPIGSSDFRMSTYFADVGDPTAIQIVNQAQQDYVARYVQANLPQYKDLPVLSVSAPFKSGYGGGADFTDVAAGPIAIYNAADLYLYPNTVYAVKVTGSEIKGWLEGSAKRFNRIDPAATAQQKLISTFPGYNYDMFTTPDVSYLVDVTQPVGQRIVDLKYKGAPIDPAASFIIATNNYRATSGGNTFIAALDGRSTIYASPDANRDVLIQYIKQVQGMTRATNGSARSWRFKPVVTAGKVVFSSGQDKLQLAVDAGLTNIALEQQDDGSGKAMSLYSIDLSK